MEKNKENNFEIRRKGVELVFDLMFFFTLISTFITDISSATTLIIRILTLIILFICTRLAHTGNIFAGIIGIIIGIIEFLYSGLIFQLLGGLLIIDSIMYLLLYYKKRGKSEK